MDILYKIARLFLILIVFIPIYATFVKTFGGWS